jgi:PTH1 family peptidyl-tRNA hydrolase
MYIVAGLGNPDSKYAGTRHNIGFMMLDHLAEKHSLSFVDSKWQASMIKTLLWNESIILFKPETYMNLSGTAVAALANYYKVEAEKIVVIHDDLDLRLGRVRITAGGGDGGHKGIRSIIKSLGTKSFSRVRIGIGRPVLPISADKYVLSKFDSEELKVINQQLTLLEEGLQLLVEKGIEVAMNIINPVDRQPSLTDKDAKGL